ncbi:hypothetical protein BDW66DRAFT_116610 [Aspergillus desertorum]
MRIMDGYGEATRGWLLALASGLNSQGGTGYPVSTVHLGLRGLGVTGQATGPAGSIKMPQHVEPRQIIESWPAWSQTQRIKMRSSESGVNGKSRSYQNG